MSKTDNNEKILAALFMTAIVITAIFMIIAAYTGVKIRNDYTCGANKYTDFSGRELANSSYTLDNEGEYLLQKFFVEDPENVEYRFCYNGIVNGNVKIDIIDKFNNSLGIDYLNNHTSYYCTEIDYGYITRINYLGVRCLNCDENNSLVLQKELSGAEVVQINGNTAALSIDYDNTLSYTLRSKTSCKRMLKFYTGWYFVLLLVIILCMAIMVGYNKFRDFMFKDW
ncbi:MAG: hypothetical protein KAU20_07825 [Nanoarchaeota archaeon]|nr:hypothetical protein [Nanoarchaeota archaeon]